MNKKYVLNKENTAIIDINVSEFPDNTIIFPSEVDGYAISSIMIPSNTLKELNSKFSSTGFSVIIEDGIKTIGINMFSHSFISSVVIPPSVEEISDSCFEASNLEEITFQGRSSVKIIGNDAFAACKRLKSITLPASLRIIKHSAFRGSKVESVIFEESTKALRELTVGICSFVDCENLEQITFPMGKINFEKEVFVRCLNLTSVDISHSYVDNISYGMFANCGALNDVKLPKTVTFIGNKAFYGCCDLRTINIAETRVKVIGDSAFENCHCYNDGVFPDTLKSIGTGAFCDCKIEKLILPATSLEEIKNNAFTSNPLTEVDLLPLVSCDTIGDYIFNDCSVKKVSIPVFLGKHVSAKFMFSTCENLEEVQICNCAVLYDGMFNNCPNLKIVTLPETIEVIPDFTFCKTNNLEYINFPKSLRSIGCDSFLYSGLKELKMGHIESLEIGPGAFKKVNLTSIHLPSYNCEIFSNSFSEEGFDIIKESAPFVTIVD